jgi:kynureninase
MQNSATSNLEYPLSDRRLAVYYDENDNIRHLRDEFHIPKMSEMFGGMKFDVRRTKCDLVDTSLVNPDDECIYMVGNSLGLPPKKAKVYATKLIDTWSKWFEIDLKHKTVM